MKALGNLILIGFLSILFKVTECTFQRVGNIQLSFEDGYKSEAEWNEPNLSLFTLAKPSPFLPIIDIIYYSLSLG